MIAVIAVPAERDRPRESSIIQRPDGFVGREEAGVVPAATAVLTERAGTGTASAALPGVLATPRGGAAHRPQRGAVTYAMIAVRFR